MSDFRAALRHNLSALNLLSGWPVRRPTRSAQHIISAVHMAAGNARMSILGFRPLESAHTNKWLSRLDWGLSKEACLNQGVLKLRCALVRIPLYVLYTCRDLFARKMFQKTLKASATSNILRYRASLVLNVSMSAGKKFSYME